MRLHILASKIHKWIALVIGLQFLFWTAGGLVMSWLPIELVRGEVNIRETVMPSLNAAQSAAILARLDGQEMRAMRVRALGQGLAVDVELASGERLLLDATDGHNLAPLDAGTAMAIAVADYAGEAAVADTRLLEAEPGDYRGKLPVWQVTLDDADGTILYVSPTEGRVVARRNDYWRFYDFFWMLHIMDYDTRENFNNPLIMIAALSATLFALSGFVLVYHRFHRRDFGLKKRRR